MLRCHTPLCGGVRLGSGRAPRRWPAPTAAPSQRGAEGRLTSTHASSSSRGARLRSSRHGSRSSRLRAHCLQRGRGSGRVSSCALRRVNPGSGLRGGAGGRGKLRAAAAAGAGPAVPERPAHAPGRAARSGAGPGRAGRQRASAGLEFRPPRSGSTALSDCLCHLLPERDTPRDSLAAAAAVQKHGIVRWRSSSPRCAT